MDAPSLPAGFPERLVPLFRERFAFHLTTPAVSPYQYRLFKDCQRAQRALSAIRVYLDTNHWIRLRQLHRGIESNRGYERLFELLRRLTQARIAVVPVSDQLLTELCHQADLATRQATASVIDELSDGVTIVGFERRGVLEMLEWSYATRQGTDPLPLFTVWTTLPNALQSLEYHLDGADPVLSAAFTKTIEDINDVLLLSELIPTLDTLTFHAADSHAFAGTLTANKESQQLGLQRYEDHFQEEADRYLSRMVSRMPAEVISELASLAASQNLADIALPEAVKTVFWAQNRTGSHPKALPGLRIIAGCASGLDTEPRRKFRHGDQGDISHAYAALPYCTLFLTDGAMRHLVSSPPTDLASRYQCTVFDDPEEAVDYLQRLVAEPSFPPDGQLRRPHGEASKR